MIVHISRFVFVAAGAMGGFATSQLVDWSDQIGYPEYFVIFIFIILGCSIGYLFGGMLGRELAEQYTRVEMRLHELSPADLLLGTVGLLIGLIVAWLGSLPLRLIEPVWLAVLSTVLLFILCAYFGVSIAWLKRIDFSSAFPRLAGDESRSAVGCDTKLLDTSAIIDGRFVELCSMGLLEGSVRVPRFVLGELQTLADSADDIKRARGRRGLDLLARIGEGECAPTVFETDYSDMTAVDDKLMRLAAETTSALVTVDYNLSRVAEVRNIKVINLNEVANALRPAFLPGESLRLVISKEGKEPGQGVGYLADGTMVVVQDAAEHRGSPVDTEVTSVLQTSGGRMIFAQFVAADSPDNETSGG